MTDATPATSSGTFTLLLFASASSYTHRESLTLPAPTTLYDLIAKLESMYPGFGEKVLRSCQVVVNLEYVDVDVADVVDAVTNGGKRERVGERVVVGVGDEVGVVPPVSSG